MEFSSNPFALRGPFAQGDQLRADRDALGDFHANHRFKRFQFTRVRNREPQQQLFKRILLADVFDGSLRANGRGARQNQDRVRRICALVDAGSPSKPQSAASARQPALDPWNDGGDSRSRQAKRRAKSDTALQFVYS